MAYYGRQSYGSYGRGSYGSGRSKSSYGGYDDYGYGGNYGSWDFWGSSYVQVEDDNSDLFVKEPENYVTPTARDIEKKIYNGKKAIYDQIKELARVCYFKMIGDKEYIAEKYKDFDQLNDDSKSAAEQKKEFYDKIFDTFIPGFTPLEQALAIYEQMKQTSQEKQDRTGEKPTEEEVMAHCALEFDRELYFDADLNEMLELNDVSKDRKMSVLNKVSIIGDLGSQFKVEKEVAEKIVANSDLIAKRMLRDYSQIVNIELYQKLFPNFESKLLTKDLVVNVPVERKEQKQKIIILLDFSGSMDEEFKQDWVNAIMIDRLRYVLKGEAEVFFSYFVSDTDFLNFQHIHDRASVLNFWQTFSNDPNGGGTRVGEMVNYVSHQIIESKRLHNLDIDLSEELPEILIINDGQDSIQTNKFPYKVNAICLDQQNNQLKDLCIETKGKQVFVDSSNKVIAYSEQGEEIIK